MKKNKMMRIASVLLIAVLLSTCAISGTFAKYVSQYTGESQARVAKWAFTVGGNTPDAQNKFTFNLFNYTDNNVDVNGLDDNSVVIAPGTTGSCAIQLTNNSEVNAEYKITYTVTNTNNIPLEFSLDNQTWKSITEINNAATFTQINRGVTEQNYTLYWRWAFTDANDANRDNNDTALGKDGTATVTVVATVDVQQVD